MSALADFRDRVTVVVSSCDAFFDCWRPFTFFFRKYWPTCPFPVRLVTNRLDVESNFLTAIRVGPDRGWASNMRAALAQIATPYILYLQEDYFLTAAVDEAQLTLDFRAAFDLQADALCFADLALLEPEFAVFREHFSEVALESKGRTRLQTTLWKREALAHAIVPGENAWQMEARGSERTRDLRILSYGPHVAPPIPYLMSGIVRGLWTREAIALCRSHGCELRPRIRGVDPGTKYRRRLRRAIDRVVVPAAVTMQRRRPVLLDR